MDRVAGQSKQQHHNPNCAHSPASLSINPCAPLLIMIVLSTLFTLQPNSDITSLFDDLMLLAQVRCACIQHTSCMSVYEGRTSVGMLAQTRILAIWLHVDTASPPHSPMVSSMQGHVAYSGPWPGAVDFFAAHGFQCPMYKNPTGEGWAAW